MSDSILDSTKKALNLEPDNVAFDGSIMMHINSVLATISQLGVGPVEGFAIEDSTAIWTDFIGDDPRLNDIKQYVYLRTRVVFDPPTTGIYLVNSMQELIRELEWRINARREGDSWVAPPVPIQLEPEVVIVPVDQAWTSE